MMSEPKQLVALLALAEALTAEGRFADAQTLFGHLHDICPADTHVLRRYLEVLTEQDQLPSALRILVTATQRKILRPDAAIVRWLGLRAMKRYNAAVAEGDVGQAANIADGLISVSPHNMAILNAAMECNAALGRVASAVAHARTLLALDAGHAGAYACLARANEEQVADQVRKAVDIALSPAEGTHPLIQLRDIHDATGQVLCGPVNEAASGLASRLVSEAKTVSTGLPPDHELAGWEKHYRLALAALEIPLTPPASPIPDILGDCELQTANGVSISWNDTSAYAKKMRAEIVFFVAADMAYVKQYASVLVKSLRKYCDVPFIAVVHVIGGAGRLSEAAAAIGQYGPELLLASDQFDASKVETQCFDTPPKGLSAKPLAHFQSVRFLRLAPMLRAFNLPVFVSDIDLLLQRGVVDLLHRCSGCDVVLNENTGNANPGSRITANLLLLRPSPGAFTFLEGLEHYLRRALSGAEVSRWIDQFALFMTRLNSVRTGSAVNFGYFDTESDINNLMYRTYQKNPFRFLSLYHGFDMSSLEEPAAAVTEPLAKAG